MASRDLIDVTLANEDHDDHSDCDNHDYLDDHDSPDHDDCD